MSDDDLSGPHDAGTGAGTGPGTGPEIGSVGEEAMKLFGAFADLARQHGGGAADAFGAVVDQASAMAHEVNDHLATDAPECRYCPVCRVVHVVRETSPEVRSHLMSAASSLLQAAAGLLETLPPASGPGSGSGGGADGASPSPRGPAVERIDLDEGEPDPGPRTPGPGSTP